METVGLSAYVCLLFVFYNFYKHIHKTLPNSSAFINRMSVSFFPPRQKLTFSVPSLNGHVREECKFFLDGYVPFCLYVSSLLGLLVYVSVQ